MMQNKHEKMTETLAHGNSSDSTQRELSNEYQHDCDYMVFKSRCIVALCAKAAQALGELTKIAG